MNNERIAREIPLTPEEQATFERLENTFEGLKRMVGEAQGELNQEIKKIGEREKVPAGYGIAIDVAGKVIKIIDPRPSGLLVPGGKRQH